MNCGFNMNNCVITIIVIVVMALIVYQGLKYFNIIKEPMTTSQNVILRSEDEAKKLISYFSTFPDLVAKVIDANDDHLKYDEMHYVKEHNSDVNMNVEIHVIHVGDLDVSIMSSHITGAYNMSQHLTTDVDKTVDKYTYSIYKTNVVMGNNIFKFRLFNKCNKHDAQLMVCAIDQKTRNILFESDKTWTYDLTVECGKKENFDDNNHYQQKGEVDKYKYQHGMYAEEEEYEKAKLEHKKRQYQREHFDYQQKGEMDKYKYQHGMYAEEDYDKAKLEHKKRQYERENFGDYSVEHLYSVDKMMYDTSSFFDRMGREINRTIGFDKAKHKMAMGETENMDVSEKDKLEVKKYKHEIAGEYHPYEEHKSYEGSEYHPTGEHRSMVEKMDTTENNNRECADYNSLTLSLLMNGLNNVRVIGTNNSSEVKRVWGNSAFPGNSFWICGTGEQINKNDPWEKFPTGVFNYYKLYMHDGSAVQCDLYCIADDYADIYVNNNLSECNNWRKIGSVTGGWNRSNINDVAKFKIKILPGFNLFKFAVVNFGHPGDKNPSGLNVVCLASNNNTVLFRTDEAWACRSPLSVPIPMYLKNGHLRSAVSLGLYGSSKTRSLELHNNFKDRTALWISSTNDFNSTTPSIIDFFFPYINTTGNQIEGILNVIADDHVKIYHTQNDDALSDNCKDWRCISCSVTKESKTYEKVQFTIPHGYNLLKFSVQVKGGERKSAGLIVSMMDNNDAVVFNTSSPFWFCAVRSYTDYMC